MDESKPPAAKAVAEGSTSVAVVSTDSREDKAPAAAEMEYTYLPQPQRISMEVRSHRPRTNLCLRDGCASDPSGVPV